MHVKYDRHILRILLTLLLIPLSYFLLGTYTDLFCFREHKAAEDDPSTNPGGFSENIGRVRHELSLHVTTQLNMFQIRNIV